MNNSHKTILYISIKENIELVKKNNFLKKHFPNSIFENTLSFVPHITILRILDSRIFELHQEFILNIISRHISQIDKLG